MLDTFRLQGLTVKVYLLTKYCLHDTKEIFHLLTHYAKQESRKTTDSYFHNQDINVLQNTNIV